MAETPSATTSKSAAVTPNDRRASMEDDLDEIINSCFSNSPALNIKTLPTPPSLSHPPVTPLSLGEDDDQFMAWLNEDKPMVITGSSSLTPVKHVPVEAKLDKAFDNAENKSVNVNASHAHTPPPQAQHNTAAVPKEGEHSQPHHPATEPAPNSFLTGLTSTFGSLKQEGFNLLDQVSAASVVAREKAGELAEAGRQIAAQKYSELVEAKHSTATAGSTLPAVSGTTSSSAFVIDDEDDIAGLTVESTADDEHGSHAHTVKEVKEEDPNKINVSRTDLEKAYALAMHALSGLRPGDSLVISKETLPGATLFPSIMYVPSKTVKHSPSSHHDSESKETAAAASTTTASADENIEDAGMPEHRFLVVTKERFLVVDTKGGKVGSTGVVSINKHLTELQKMTFKKKSPEVINLFFHSPVGDIETTSHGESDSEGIYKRVFRVSKRDLFVETLQKNMMRFK